MSKAEELAKWLGRGNISHLNAAAHLRALDASHRRLRKALDTMEDALWKACGDDKESVNAYIESQGGDPAEIKAAIEQAKDLS